MAHRMEKVNEEIKRVLASFLHQMANPKILKLSQKSAITITGADVAKDFSVAKIYVSIMADEKGKMSALNALKSSEGFLRHELGEKLELRTIPALHFFLDNSIEEGAKINQILHEVLPREEGV